MSEIDNEFRERVPITLDRDRVIYYSTQALVALEKKLGQKPQLLVFGRLHAAFEYAALVARIEEAKRKAGHAPSAGERAELTALADQAAFRTEEIGTILWAGLIHEDPQISPAAALDLLDWAPGDSVVEREAHVVGKATDAFFARCAPRAQRDALAQIRREVREIDRRAVGLSPTTGAPSG